MEQAGPIASDQKKSCFMSVRLVFVTVSLLTTNDEEEMISYGKPAYDMYKCNAGMTRLRENDTLC